MSPNRHQRRGLAKQQLFQVCVETRKGRVLPIGPKTVHRQTCEMLVGVINKAIIDGKEPLWSNPHIVFAQAKL